MAGVGSSIGGISLPSSGGTTRSEAAKAAQKAFFQAALNPQASAASAATTAAAVTQAAPVQATTAQASSAKAANAGNKPLTDFDPDNPPDRILRPGSLVNIVV